MMPPQCFMFKFMLIAPVNMLSYKVIIIFSFPLTASQFCHTYLCHTYVHNFVIYVYTLFVFLSYLLPYPVT